jgi:exodeoxyribonuclease V gamma subunit
VQAGFADLRPQGLVRWRYDEERARDVLEAWIAHLVLCADAPPGIRPATEWLSLGQPRRFEPKADAREQLAALVRLYRRGLCEPLPFFPKTAWAYVSEGRSTFKAESKWSVTKDTPFGEGSDAAYQLAFRGLADPLADTDFYQLAVDIFQPVLEEGDGS